MFHKTENSCGEMMDLLVIGTRVRHTKYPFLTGYIKDWEFHESGKVSPFPYLVYWDDWRLARELLDPSHIYPSYSEVAAL